MPSICENVSHYNSSETKQFVNSVSVLNYDFDANLNLIETDKCITSISKFWKRKKLRSQISTLCTECGKNSVDDILVCFLNSFVNNSCIWCRIDSKFGCCHFRMD